MPIIDEVKNEFEEFYRDYQNNQHLIIAHNANFDIGFLKAMGLILKIIFLILMTYLIH